MMWKVMSNTSKQGLGMGTMGEILLLQYTFYPPGHCWLRNQSRELLEIPPLYQDISQAIILCQSELIRSNLLIVKPSASQEGIWKCKKLQTCFMYMGKKALFLMQDILKCARGVDELLFLQMQCSIGKICRKGHFPYIFHGMHFNLQCCFLPFSQQRLNEPFTFFKIDIKEQAKTNILITFDHKKKLPKLTSPWVGHLSKPQNASKLRLGQNICCVSFPFQQRYLQNVGHFFKLRSEPRKLARLA